jgi:uncharacterized protein
MVERLERRIGGLGSAIVAFSGGVDSSLVAALAARALGDEALAVTAVSPALAHGELDGAQRVAEAIGIAHETITTDELASEDYRRNDRYRCFHCKTELYGRLTEIANERGYSAVLSGANADDAGDWRPGLQAAEDHNVLHPLLELGVTKRQVRELAEQLSVPSADKPASPCLASRIPYGTPVERGTLQRIDAAEKAVKELGFEELRVRHHGDLGRLEIGAEELARATRERTAIERAIRGAGYDRVEIDPKPFRSGSLNQLPMLGATAP